MPERDQWISDLVQKIKTKDRPAAEDAARHERYLAIVENKGMNVWNAFADFLQKFIKEMEADFGHDITRGQFNFSYDQKSHQITFGKSIYPFVTCSLKPDRTQGTINGSYLVQDPEMAKGQVRAHNQITGRFDVEGDEVFLQIDGSRHPDAKTAAQSLILKLFTVAE